MACKQTLEISEVVGREHVCLKSLHPEGTKRSPGCQSVVGIVFAKIIDAMKQNIQTTTRARRFLVAIICLTVTPLYLFGQTNAGGFRLPVQTANSVSDKQAIALFESRVKDYVKLRNGVRDKLPKLSKDSTPEQIQAFRKAFEEALRAARAGAKRGQLFTPQVANYIDGTLREEFKGKDRLQLREIVFEAENEGVPLRVNYPYPASVELTEMPATLLLRLPQLPKELRYRFVGRNLVLVDRDNNLIIDYMGGALP